MNTKEKKVYTGWLSSKKECVVCGFILSLLCTGGYCFVGSEKNASSFSEEVGLQWRTRTKAQGWKKRRRKKKPSILFHLR
jgi:hypothetical protein